MKVPYFIQETIDTCGPASLRMVLAFFGIKKSEKLLSKYLRTNKKSGTSVHAFPKVLEKLRLQYLVGRNSSLDELKKFLEYGYKIIVGYSHPGNIGHFAVIVKIDDKIHIYDPNPHAGKINYSKSYFDSLWRRGFRYDKEKRWFIAIKKRYK